MGDSKMTSYVCHDATLERRIEVGPYAPRIILDVFEGASGQRKIVVGVASSGNEVEIALCLPPGEFHLPRLTKDNLGSAVDLVITLRPAVVGVIVDNFTGIHLAAAFGATGLTVAPLLPGQVRYETNWRSLDIARVIMRSGMTGRQMDRSRVEPLKALLAACPSEEQSPAVWRQAVAAEAAAAFKVASWPHHSGYRDGVPPTMRRTSNAH